MTITKLTVYNTKCNGVTLHNNGNIKVKKVKDISGDENNKY